MRLRHIEIFHAVYTTGSITNAAKLLHVSQPSVSKVLGHAELQLGFKLFERLKGRLIPTAEADKLFVEADRIFNQMSVINDLAENIQHNRGGMIALGITPALGFAAAPQIAKAFKQAHPEVKFEIETLHNHNLLNHLLRGQSDLAIVFSPRELSETTRHHFGKGQMVAVLPNHSDYPDTEQVSFQQMHDFPRISIRKSGPLGDKLAMHMEQNNENQKSNIRVDTYFIALSMVKHGLGWCIIDEFTARANLTNDIRIVALEQGIDFSIVGLTSNLHPVSRLTTSLINFARDYFELFEHQA